MKTWDDYKKYVKETDSEAAVELSLAETEARFLSSTLIALSSSTSPTMTSDGSDSSVN